MCNNNRIGLLGNVMFGADNEINVFRILRFITGHLNHPPGKVDIVNRNLCGLVQQRFQENPGTTTEY